MSFSSSFNLYFEVWDSSHELELDNWFSIFLVPQNTYFTPSSSDYYLLTMMSEDYCEVSIYDEDNILITTRFNLGELYIAIYLEEGVKYSFIFYTITHSVYFSLASEWILGDKIDLDSDMNDLNYALLINAKEGTQECIEIVVEGEGDICVYIYLYGEDINTYYTINETGLFNAYLDSGCYALCMRNDGDDVCITIKARIPFNISIFEEAPVIDGEGFIFIDCEDYLDCIDFIDSDNIIGSSGFYLYLVKANLNPGNSYKISIDYSEGEYDSYNSIFVREYEGQSSTTSGMVLQYQLESYSFDSETGDTYIYLTFLGFPPSFTVTIEID
jgi:hypothetical protein